MSDDLAVRRVRVSPKTEMLRLGYQGRKCPSRLIKETTLSVALSISGLNLALRSHAKQRPTEVKQTKKFLSLSRIHPQ